MASLRFISVCTYYIHTYVPATHTAHQAVWFGLLSLEGGGQRGGVREHLRATGGHLGCSAVEGHMHGLCGSMSACVGVRVGVWKYEWVCGSMSGCVDVRSGCACGMANSAYLVAYYKSDSHSTQYDQCISA